MSNDIACIRWMDNKSAIILGRSIVDIRSQSNVMRRQKDSATKISVSCPQEIRIYNTYMGGVELMDKLKSAHKFDRISKLRFYIRLLFDLLDVACIICFHCLQKVRKNRVYSKRIRTAYC